MCYAGRVSEQVNLHDAEAVVDLFNRAADALRTNPNRRGCVVHLPSDRGRLLATGDLHDNPNHFKRVIELARLDESPDHHVVLHELIHGEHLINSMDFSHRMLARVAETVLAHPTQVHPMLANHELSQMTGKGVSKGAGNSVELFNDALEYVYGDAWVEVSEAICDLIRAMPLAVLSEGYRGSPSRAHGHGYRGSPSRATGGVLCAHSLPNARSMTTFDLNVLDRDLTDDDYASPTGSAYAMVWGRQYTPEQVQSLAEHWNVQLFCLGHQHVETGIENVMPSVVVLNSDHAHGKALPLDLANLISAEEAPMYAVPLGGL